MSRILGICAALAIVSGCGGARSSGAVAAIPAGAVEHRGSSSGAEVVLYSFAAASDGGNPATQLVLDRHGDLYGTTVIGGAYACGTVFRLAPHKKTPWMETALHSFGCYTDGKNPYGGITFDAHGNAYGTTVDGGTGSCPSSGCGIVYELSKKAETVLHDFTAGRDGFGPGGPIVLAAGGDLYGTTPDGGVSSQGTIFQVSRSNGKSTERVIHAFDGTKDGGTGSLGALLSDAKGDLYGVAETGGPHGAGTVYELSPQPTKRWRFTRLYAFKGQPDAASPYGGLIADATGNLYGTTYYGGRYGEGAVFELRSIGGRRYRERVVYSFQGGTDGSNPTSTLAFDASGDLYGTTSTGGGSCSCGTLFDIDPASASETVLHSFGTGSDGAYPYYGVTRDSNGHVFGTTAAGGSFGQGTVYEWTP